MTSPETPTFGPGSPQTDENPARAMHCPETRGGPSGPRLRGRGRCTICGWHFAKQGHRPDCSRGRCRRCREFPAWPGGPLCAWCQADVDREAERAQVIAQRLALLDQNNGGEEW